MILSKEIISRKKAVFERRDKHYYCPGCANQIRPGRKVIIEKLRAIVDFPTIELFAAIGYDIWHETCFNRRSGYDSEV